jgi:hypothetical protein
VLLNRTVFHANSAHVVLNEAHPTHRVHIVGRGIACLTKAQVLGLLRSTFSASREVRGACIIRRNSLELVIRDEFGQEAHLTNKDHDLIRVFVTNGGFERSYAEFENAGIAHLDFDFQI